ncbi:MAG: ABC transporter permease [Pseudomonadota bacterium]
MAIATDTAIAAEVDRQAAREAARERTFARINKVSKWLDLFGLSFLTPLMKIAAGDSVKQNTSELWRQLAAPLIAIGLFLGAWAYAAPMVQTSLGAIPGPVQVWHAATILHADHVREREKAAAFYERQDKRNARFAEAGREDRIKYRTYTGKPTYYDQIWTSIQTVFMGFILASIFAIPLGILCGLSPSVQAALNPLIQVFKPVSPLAWLPIVTMVVSALYVTNDPTFSKSFLTSAITVTLCSLWPTLINTSLGVASIDKDLMNVGRVLKLGFWTKVFKLVLPSALPLIFTGLRLSLGVGWMVLIAAEMLAQNPGLGKFVWDEFQNGSSQSLAKIMVAVLTIGIIGLLLDRMMYAIQGAFTHAAKR